MNKRFAVQSGRNHGSGPLYLANHGHHPVWGWLGDATLLSSPADDLLWAMRAARQAAYKHAGPWSEKEQLDQADLDKDVLVEVWVDEDGRRSLKNDAHHANMYGAFRARIQRDAEQRSLTGEVDEPDVRAIYEILLESMLEQAAWYLTVCELGRAKELDLNSVVPLRHEGLIDTSMNLSDYGAYALAQLLIEIAAIRDRKVARG